MASFGFISASSSITNELNPENAVGEGRELRAKAKEDATSAGDLRGCIEQALQSGPTFQKMGPKRYLEEENVEENAGSVMQEFIQGYIDDLENANEDEDDEGYGNYYDYGEYDEESMWYKDYYNFDRGLSSDVCGTVTRDMQREVSLRT